MSYLQKIKYLLLLLLLLSLLLLLLLLVSMGFSLSQYFEVCLF